MSKHVIPNQIGHYELSGIEVDVYDKQIIIRTSFAKENKERVSNEISKASHKDEKKDRTLADDLNMGPLTRKLLGFK